MKKFLSILTVALALCLCMTVASFAATADIVHQSVEGTAVIDGEKDDAYANALALPFIEKGVNNSSGEPFDTAQATAYIINDAEWVYVYFDVYDTSLDNTSANTYEQDSVEVFWMADNAKNQIRYHYHQDESGNDVVDVDSGTPSESKVKITDTGYAVELKFPITDVKSNQIEMCLQVNACTDGARDCTIYIEGNADADNAYQRTNRQSEYDCWWTLTLAGEFADTRVDPEEKPLDYSLKAWNNIKAAQISASIHAQNNVDWSDWATWTTETINVPIGQTVDIAWEMFNKSEFNAENTNNFTVVPQFSLDISDASGYLTIKDGAVEGDKGDKAKYRYTYSDITITSEGYDDIVIPGASVAQTWEIYVPSWGGTAGNGGNIDMSGALVSAGYTVEQVVDIMANLTAVKLSLTFESIDLVDTALLAEWDALYEAEDTAKIAELQEYIDRVEAAKAVIADEAADITAKEEAVDDASKAANRATKEAEGYTQATAKAGELTAAVEEMTATLEELKAAAAEPEEPAPAEDETPAPAEDNAPAASASSDSGSSTGLVVGIVIAVVVIIIIVAVVLSKKKKA